MVLRFTLMLRGNDPLSDYYHKQEHAWLPSSGIGGILYSYYFVTYDIVILSQHSCSLGMKFALRLVGCGYKDNEVG